MNTRLDEFRAYRERMNERILGAGHLAWQAWSASFRFAADPRNPYVYAHTGSDVFPIVRRLKDLAGAHPEGSSMPLQIISRENLWPLPWYLRRLTGIAQNIDIDIIPHARSILISVEQFIFIWRVITGVSV